MRGQRQMYDNAHFKHVITSASFQSQSCVVAQSHLSANSVTRHGAMKTRGKAGICLSTKHSLIWWPYARLGVAQGAVFWSLRMAVVTTWCAKNANTNSAGSAATTITATNTWTKVTAGKSRYFIAFLCWSLQLRGLLLWLIFWGRTQTQFSILAPGSASVQLELC